MSKNTYAGPKTPGKRLTTKEFIKRARKVHGNKYDYSKVDYKNNKSKVTIICPEHGEFEQVTQSHLNGCGCRMCIGYTGSNEEFIKKARKVHGNKYDYSKVNYKNSGTRVIIICKDHGEFNQTPYSHISGQGCMLCAYKNKSLTTKEFIKKSRKAHGNRYDYSKSVYKNARTKVIIICPEHGEFLQSPGSHYNGAGCKKCADYTNRFNNPFTRTKEEFVRLAIKIHGNKYDYSKVVYKNANTKVTIICPIHGEFLQTPVGHIRGKTCLRCAYENRADKLNITQDKLYLIKFKYDNEILTKIGITSDFTSRFNKKFTILNQIIIHKTPEIVKCVERNILTKYKKYRTIPKFKFPGHTECFSAKAYPKILRYLKRTISSSP